MQEEENLAPCVLTLIGRQDRLKEKGGSGKNENDENMVAQGITRVFLHKRIIYRALGQIHSSALPRCSHQSILLKEHSSGATLKP